MNYPELLSMGECMVELVTSDPIKDATSYSRAYGGDTLNVAVMAARLGSKAGYLTNVGDDPFGDYLIEAFVSQDIDVSAISRVPQPNGLYLMATLKSGEREVVYYRTDSAASTINPDKLPREHLINTKIFHFSSISQALSSSTRESATLAASMVLKEGGQVSYDLNFRSSLWMNNDPRVVVQEAIALANIVFVSWPEDQPVFPNMEISEIIDYLKQLGPEIIVVREGELGSLVLADNHEQRIPANEVPVVDTIGAGDAYTGAFLHSLLNGLDPFESGLVATTAAGLSVQGPGTVMSYPSLDQVRNNLAKSVVL
tara:strand:- start:527 stop:1465 length:939 start_codon:yes stop_codon:yes gene_type:complete